MARNESQSLKIKQIFFKNFLRTLLRGTFFWLTFNFQNKSTTCNEGLQVHIVNFKGSEAREVGKHCINLTTLQTELDDDS